MIDVARSVRLALFAVALSIGAAGCGNQDQCTVNTACSDDGGTNVPSPDPDVRSLLGAYSARIFDDHTGAQLFAGMALAAGNAIYMEGRAGGVIYFDVLDRNDDGSEQFGDVEELPHVNQGALSYFDDAFSATQDASGRWRAEISFAAEDDQRVELTRDTAISDGLPASLARVAGDYDAHMLDGSVVALTIDREGRVRTTDPNAECMYDGDLAIVASELNLYSLVMENCRSAGISGYVSLLAATPTQPERLFFVGASFFWGWGGTWNKLP